MSYLLLGVACYEVEKEVSRCCNVLHTLFDTVLVRNGRKKSQKDLFYALQSYKTDPRVRTRLTSLYLSRKH